MREPKKTSPDFHSAYIGLGSNIEPEGNILGAVKRLSDIFAITGISSAWISPAYQSDGPDFINAAIGIKTELRKRALKQQLREIEAEFGRVRQKDKNAPRTLDLDILIFDDQVIDPHLWDHPHLAVPLAELLPEFRDRDRGKNLLEAASRLAECTPIIRAENIRLTPQG